MADTSFKSNHHGVCELLLDGDVGRWLFFRELPEVCRNLARLYYGGQWLTCTFHRNDLLASKGFPSPKMVKTGTTIAGFIFKDGVILGADTRATEGNIVADKNCQKLHYMAPNI